MRNAWSRLNAPLGLPKPFQLCARAQPEHHQILCSTPLGVHHSSTKAAKKPSEQKYILSKLLLPHLHTPGGCGIPGTPVLGRVPSLILLLECAAGWPCCVFLLTGENPHVGPQEEPVAGLGCRGLPVSPALPSLCSLFLLKLPGSAKHDMRCPPLAWPSPATGSPVSHPGSCQPALAREIFVFQCSCFLFPVFRSMDKQRWPGEGREQ